MWICGRVVTLAVLLVGTVSAGELPSDARKLVSEFVKQNEKERLKTNEQTEIRLRTLQAELLKLQGALTRDGKLDDAILIRNRLREAARAKLPELKKTVLVADAANLPEPARTLVQKFDLEVSELTLKAEQVHDERQRMLHKELEELLRNHAAATRLDEAVAIRDWLSLQKSNGNSASNSSNLDVPHLSPPDPPVREDQIDSYLAKFRAHSSSIVVWLDRMADQELKRCVASLEEHQKSHTLAGHLDQAVAIRDFIKAATSKKSLSSRMSELARLKSSLPVEAREDFERVDEALDAPREAAKAERERLAEAYAVGMEPVVADILAESELATVSAVLRKFSELRRLEFVTSNPTGPIGKEAQQAVTKYQQSVDKLLKTALQQEAKARAGLVAAVRKADDSSVAARLLRTDSVNGLIAPSLVSLHLDVSKDKALNSAAVKYRQVVQEAKRKLRAGSREPYEQLADALNPIRARLAREKEFQTVWYILQRLEELREVIPAIEVSYAPHPIHPPVFGGKLHDVNQEFCLVGNGVSSAQWIPVEQVVHPEMKDEQRLLHYSKQRRPMNFKPEPQQPGPVVGDDAELEPGTKILVRQGGIWVAAVVVGGVDRIQVQTLGQSIKVLDPVHRSDLRFPLSDDNQGD